MTWKRCKIGLLTRGLINSSWELNRICTFDAVANREKLIRCWGRKVTGQGRSETTCGQISTFRAFSHLSQECIYLFQWSLSQWLITGSTWHWGHLQSQGLKFQGHRRFLKMHFSGGGIPIDGSPMFICYQLWWIKIYIFDDVYVRRGVHWNSVSVAPKLLFF